MQIIPQKIKLAGENNTLTIQWSDGHLSAYRYQHLRDGCPCATCTDAGRPKPDCSRPAPCPYCGMALRTSLAKQCRHCGRVLDVPSSGCE